MWTLTVVGTMRTLLSFTLFLLIAGISAFKVLRPVRNDATNHQKIIVGQNATRNQFPYQVAVHTSPSGGFCGGSVISTTCVLTAAHCIYQAPDTVSPFTDVVFGILNLDDDSSAEPDRVLKTATHVLFHPLFDLSVPKHDIGLIFVSAVTFGRAISAIALPTSSCGSYASFVDADVILSG